MNENNHKPPLTFWENRVLWIAIITALWLALYIVLFLLIRPSGLYAPNKLEQIVSLLNSCMLLTLIITVFGGKALSLSIFIFFIIGMLVGYEADDNVMNLASKMIGADIDGRIWITFFAGFFGILFGSMSEVILLWRKYDRLPKFSS